MAKDVGVPYDSGRIEETINTLEKLLDGGDQVNSKVRGLVKIVELQEKILGRMAEQRAAEVKAAMKNFVTVRPCDSAIAQNEIGDVIRGLERDGKVASDFAVKSRFFRQGDKFFVTTDDATGEMTTFEVKYTFGVPSGSRQLSGSVTKVNDEMGQERVCQKEVTRSCSVRGDELPLLSRKDSRRVAWS